MGNSHKNVRFAAAVVAAMIYLAVSSGAARAQPNTSCQPAEGHLTYDCTVTLSRDGAPLTGAHATVTAEMPSMPMAHNVPPSTLEEIEGSPGHYEFQIELEMHGEWALIYDLLAPIRDRWREKVMFMPTDDADSG